MRCARRSRALDVRSTGCDRRQCEEPTTEPMLRTSPDSEETARYLHDRFGRCVP
jgi:hypothetical protein